MEGLSVIIPTLNECKNVGPIVERVTTALQKHAIVHEIIFIDDHSTDNTVAAAEALEKSHLVHIFLKKGSRGKAQSIIEGCEYAKYDLVAFIDADLQYPPEALPRMYARIRNNKCDIVVTRRKVKHANMVRKLMSNGFRVVFSKWLHGMDYDVQSGLKMFRKKIMSAFDLNPSPWSFDLEFLVKARNVGYTITSVDIPFHERLNGETKVGMIRSSYEVGLAALGLKIAMIIRKAGHSVAST